MPFYIEYLLSYQVALWYCFHQRKFIYNTKFATGSAIQNDDVWNKKKNLTKKASLTDVNMWIVRKLQLWQHEKKLRKFSEYDQHVILIHTCFYLKKNRKKIEKNQCALLSMFHGQKALMLSEQAKFITWYMKMVSLDKIERHDFLKRNNKQ